jgi:uncharacterized membrane protein (DUF485 family)
MTLPLAILATVFAWVLAQVIVLLAFRALARSNYNRHH